MCIKFWSKLPQSARLRMDRRDCSNVARGSSGRPESLTQNCKMSQRGTKYLSTRRNGPSPKELTGPLHTVRFAPQSLAKVLDICSSAE
jgi:hypothetical protein